MFEDDDFSELTQGGDMFFFSWKVNFTQVLLRSFGYLWWVYSLYKWCTWPGGTKEKPIFERTPKTGKVIAMSNLNIRNIVPILE